MSYLLSHLGQFITLAVLGGLYLFVFVLLYFYAPLKVRRNNAMPTEPQYHPFDLAQMPADSQEAFHHAARHLAALGFTAAGHLRQGSVTAHIVDSYISVWTNVRSGDIAQVIGVRTRRPEGGFRPSPLVTFRRKYADGTWVATSNSTSATWFPRNPSGDSITIRGTRNLPRLFQFHLARVKRADDRRNGPRPALRALPQASDLIPWMLREWNEEFEFYQRIGYRRLDQAAGAWCPTLRGAFLSTWRLLRPWKQINFALRDRRADRQSRELGFGGLHEFRSAPAAMPPSAFPIVSAAPLPPAQHEPAVEIPMVEILDDAA
jgi:hypothetical protein